jgi:4-hydroxybenzoate polyprenyltransferase
MSLKARFLSLLSVTRVYNGFLVILAQYLSAIYIFARAEPIELLLRNSELHLIVLASFLVVSAGYLINQYYDLPKDLINKPFKSMIDLQRTPSSLMRWYALLNFVALVLSLFVSFRATLFFLGYLLSIWLYSHRLRRLLIWGTLFSAFLAVSPISALFLYYQYLEWKIIGFALFLFLLLWIIALVKDLENLPGDLAVGLKTLATSWGIEASQRLIRIVLGVELALSLGLVYFYDLSLMRYYFFASTLLFALLFVWVRRLKAPKNYSETHWILKLFVLLGTLSILFLDLDRFAELKAFIFAY